MTDIPKNNQEELNIDENRGPVIRDESFSYDGYQVVRGEFFAHLFEPSVTLKDEKVCVNSACINKLPDVEYVQFLVNPKEKKLAVKPCNEQDKDSFRWNTVTKEGKKKPKPISCRIFFAKIVDLMQWNPNYRYKVLGKLIHTSSDLLFVFDLTCAETFEKGVDGSKRTPFYPLDWTNQFGVPVSEHQDTTLIKIFDDYTVFRIEKDDSRKEYAKNEATNNLGCEETPDQDTQANTEGNQ